MSEITIVSTECRTRLDILIEVVLLLARLTHNVLKSLQTGIWFVHQDFSYSKQALLLQISGKTTRNSRVSLLHLHIDSRVKEIPTPNPFQHSARQQSNKRLQNDLIRSLSRLTVESLLHENPEQLLSSRDESLQLAHNSTRGAKKWQNQNHRPRFERNFRKKTKKKDDDADNRQTSTSLL